MRLVGGHPYLTRAVLWDIRDGRYTVDDLVQGASLGCSLIADYLRRDQGRLDATPTLSQTFADLAKDPHATVSSEPLDELIRLGLVRQGRNGSYPLRYPFFARLLEERACGMAPRGLRLVYCYAAADPARRARLETHLALLQRDGYIEEWYAYCVLKVNDASGVKTQAEDESVLDTADLTVLLLKTGFLASDRALQQIVPRTVQRHEAGEAVILPIVLETCDWQQPPFDQFTPLPRAGLPVSLWTDEDDAWADIAQAIRRLISDPAAIPDRIAPSNRPNLSCPSGDIRFCTVALIPKGTGRCRILFLSANVDFTSPLAVDREYRRIARRLEAARHRDRVELVSWPDVHTSDLPARLRREKPTIVHFSGHSLPDGALMLRDKTSKPCRVDPQALARFIGRCSDTIRLVVLNACYSQSLASRLSEDVDCVIGMQTDVTDEAAITFAETFYEALFDNESMQTALADSRDAITVEGSPERNAPYLTTRLKISPSAIRLFESPEHRQELVAQRRRARDLKGRDRLRTEIPGVQTLIERWMDDGYHLATHIARTLKLLELHGPTILTEAVKELIERDIHDPSALVVACDRRHKQRTKSPILPVELPDHIEDREVIPHRLETYDKNE